MLLKKLSWLVLAVGLNVQAAELAPQPQHARAARLAAALVGNYHYQPQALADALSSAVFDRYVKLLDPEKYYFTQRDIDALSGFRTQLDDAVLSEDLAAPFAIFNRYAERAGERFARARELLKSGLRFDTDERFDIARDKAAWAASDAELQGLWRLRVKNDWLRLKLAGKTESEIASTLDRRYEQSIKRINRLKSDDAFLMFMNAYTSALDPHSGYLGPRASADFDIAMRLSLTGIGAVLQERDDYTVIREVTPGGPAALSGLLKAGDRIMAVAQGDSGPFVDILGWRLDETVELIRGQADTVVRLDILPADAGPDGRHREISLVRKKIDLAQQAARKSVIDVSENGTSRRIGIVTLPTFYEDFAGRRNGDPGFRSASRDVARQLGELRNEKVDGVVLDLRRNGGGSLKEAIELTGLFIDTGPVVMQRNAQGRVSVNGDTEPGAAWDGPLGVLIDGGSASASEIVAAAIQDYGRGIVIGEPSFGKGTVQTVVNLDRIAGGKEEGKGQFGLGELRLTIAQFFRINGGTTQLKGVTPDIAFPSASDQALSGEAAHDNALPWTRIRAAAHAQIGDTAARLPELRARHAARTANDAEFQQLDKVALEVRRLRQQKTLSLNEAERRRDKARMEKEFATADDGLLDGERPLDDKKPAEKPIDIRLLEAARIIADEAALLKTPG